MTPSAFNDLPPEQQDWIDAYLNGTISAEAFDRLQDAMAESPELRAVMRRYLALDDSLQNEAGEVDSRPWLDLETPAKKAAPDATLVEFPSPPRRNWLPVAAAAAVAFLLGLAAMHWQSRSGSDDLTSTEVEPSAEGFAVLSRLFDATWPEGVSVPSEGDTLGSTGFRLASGTAEIQFFSGATMTVEGPAEIHLKSAWEAECREGKVRMRVPPAARGFRLQAPSSEIIDLGTEFGLEVRDGEAHVEVFDGEIEVRHENEASRLVTKGGAFGLPEGSASQAVHPGQIAFPDLEALDERAQARQQSGFARWQAHRDQLTGDERLIAFYTFDRQPGEALVQDLSLPHNPDHAGAVVLAENVDGRWPGLKSALEFRRPGSRVRVNIAGEFPAFTFSCWARIDSLDRRYSALFMGDGYETGEPHWQIRDDGKMMISVMVDDSQPSPYSKNDAGLHRVYFSPPMWDLSMSGQWLHLASVYDPAGRRVAHYVNGERIHEQEIVDKFFIDTLRIGNGEIGNWGQPFRTEPSFAIRHLSGRIDELALFKVALGDEEIRQLYEASRAVAR